MLDIACHFLGYSGSLESDRRVFKKNVFKKNKKKGDKIRNVLLATDKN
jgi:hypothetical protein